MSLSGLFAGVVEQQGGGGGAFNPETDIAWHSFFWAEGTDFVAQGYADTDPVGTWPNETGETDATASGALRPAYDASVASINNQPAVEFATTNQLPTAAFSTNPSYTSGVTVVAVAESNGSNGSNRFLWDGIASGFRNSVFVDTANDPTIFAGSAQSWATLYDKLPHLWRATYDGSTGNDTLHVDETSRITASAGSDTLTGITLGAQYNVATIGLAGPLAFLGIYEGDLTADGAWADFKTWVTDHYGLTLA